MTSAREGAGGGRELDYGMMTFEFNCGYVLTGFLWNCNHLVFFAILQRKA